MSIQRIEPGPRLSEAVIFQKTVYLAGQVADEGCGSDIYKQTQQALASIDRALALSQFFVSSSDGISQRGPDLCFELEKVAVWRDVSSAAMNQYSNHDGLLFCFNYESTQSVSAEYRVLAIPR